MKRAIAVLPAGMASDLLCVDTLLLDCEQRGRLVGMQTGLRGTQIDIALPQPVALRTDDRLVLDDETLVDVVARPEPLYELRAGNLSDLARLAWMLGDRHLAVDISERRLRVRRDAATEALLSNAAIKLTAIDAPFDPEGGAYSRTPQAAPTHRSASAFGEHDH